MLRIGRYEVESEIGRGAMGVVYLARDPRLKRRVAVKTHTVPQGLDARQRKEFRQRFLREAHAAAALSHPGIVTVYDADEDSRDGTPFIAMEYVAGRSLREELDADGRLVPSRAVAMASTVAEALDVAHAEGIIHRDIKPANLLIRDADDAVKLADFGVARVTSSELTQSGTSLGTPAYMSPEQIEGRPLDGRSDLFSLAVILYEALGGERPFGGDNITAVIRAVTLETPIPITKRVPELPPAMDGFFDRALAKRPERRFANGGEFRRALDEAMRAEGVTAATATARLSAPAQPVGPTPPSAGESPSASSPSPPPAPAIYGDPFASRGDRDAWWQRRRALATAALALALLLTAWWVGGGESAYLELEAKSSVPEGKLTIQVDGDKVYSRKLSAPDKPKGLIKKLVDPASETFEKRIKVTPGKHELTATLVTDGTREPYEDRVVFAIDSGETRRLRLVVGRSLGSAVSLKLD